MKLQVNLMNWEGLIILDHQSTLPLHLFYHLFIHFHIYPIHKIYIIISHSISFSYIQFIHSLIHYSFIITFISNSLFHLLHRRINVRPPSFHPLHLLSFQLHIYYSFITIHQPIQFISFLFSFFLIHT